MVNSVVSKATAMFCFWALARRILRILRWVRRVSRSLESKNKIGLYIDFNEICKLQIGSGNNYIDGWLNTDYYLTDRRMVFLDASKRFPIPDNTFDYVFSEHQIEQLSFEYGLKMLSECYRILKPGGKIRIATTNVDALLTLYREDNNELQQRYIKWMIDMCVLETPVYSPNFVLNNAFYNWNHRFLYDQATLKLALETLGFDGITNFEIGCSDDQLLEGVEQHSSAVGNEEMCRFETLVMEAVCS